MIGGAVALFVLAGLVGVALMEQRQAPSSEGEDTSWQSVTLTDVRNGDTFAIDQFDKPVLLETFAVWCTTCTRQQQEVKSLHEEYRDFVSVTINTDQNEDAEQVRQHLQSNGFDWRYAVAPPEMTQGLVSEFGRSITNPPLAPMVIVCPDGSTERLQNGVKTADTLQDALENSC
jgi:thiol-disulfide isomerase/thioredoxin